MKKLLPFILFWIVNSLFIYLAAVIYPSRFVLGNFRFSMLTATIWAGLWINVLGWVAMWLFGKLKINLTGMAQMFFGYWAVNAAAVWITARLATLTGLGIFSFWWAIGLGLVLNIVQYAVWKLGKFRM